MLAAWTLEDMLKDLQSKDSRVLGILFVRPTTQIARSEIIPSLNYFWHRSGKHIDFYLPGYGAYWYGTYPSEDVVCKINGVEWSYSDTMFCKFVDLLERISLWRYKGDTELLLIDHSSEGLDFSNSITIWIEKAINDKAIQSTNSLLEALIQILKDGSDVFSVSDKLTINRLGNSIKDIFLESLPLKLGTVLTQASYYCVKDLHKKG